MPRRILLHEDLTHSAIGSFYEVFRHMGYGFREPLCNAALEVELLARGHRVGREVSIPVYYKGHCLGTQRLDMLIDSVLVVESKASEFLHTDATRQLYNYLRATNLEVGLLFHFGKRPNFYRVTRPRSEGRPKSPHSSGESVSSS